ncbi:MAG: DUF86 domain-containing protein [Bacteroidales bacterium]|nr:DUF86 domain-containing protein [Bacteroidales bacterium]
METNIKKLLTDIQQSILRIEQYTASLNNITEYSSNTLVQNAVERNIEIIGEATNAILKINAEIPISSARKIVNTRNQLIHGYDAVDVAMIWSIVRNHIPILKQEVETLLAE